MGLWTKTMPTSHTKAGQGQKRKRGGQPTWRQEAIDLLIKLKRQGRNRSEIARAIKGAGLGDYTPEAICGKIYRLRREGVEFAVRDYSPTIPTLSTGTVLGTFLERLCDIGSW